jgi:hypothetical protein
MWCRGTQGGGETNGIKKGLGTQQHCFQAKYLPTSIHQYGTCILGRWRTVHKRMCACRYAVDIKMKEVEVL